METPGNGNGGKQVSIQDLTGPKKLLRYAEAGNVEAVAIADLDTDSYQRRLTMDFVAELGATWDMVKAGEIWVSRRKNGKLYVIDGQHRAAGALRAGETHIIARVFEGLTLKEEAEYRIASNHRKAENILDRFRARIVAEDPIALGVKHQIEQHGGEIRLTSFSGRDSFVAIASAERLYRYDMKGGHLGEVLGIIVSAFGSLTSVEAPSSALFGLSYLLQTHPEVDRQRVIERLNAEGPVAIQRRASGHRMLYGGSTWVNYYRAIVEVYNWKLGAKNRLEWKGGKPRLQQHAPELTENGEGTAENGGPLSGGEVNNGNEDED